MQLSYLILLNISIIFFSIINIIPKSPSSAFKIRTTLKANS